METKSIFEKRLKRLREKLLGKEIDAAFITKRENCLYLSGFTGSDAYLLITQTEAILITDFRYVEQASAQAILFKVIQYQGSLIIALNEVLKSEGIARLAFEDTYTTFEKYNEFKTKFNVKELIPLESMIENLRIIKDEEELKIISKAVDIADDGFKHILGYLKPGVTELEIAAELEYHMKKLGAKAASFESIIASGYRSSMPHGVASEKKLQAGDVITLDYGAIYKDYCSDMTRTVFLGEPDKKMRKIYEIVLEAQIKSLEGSHKGLLGKEIDFIARDIITKAGYEKNFGHGLGHGVGLEIHEEPRLSLSGNIKMENGMVVTIEPGIYIPGLGGVRIEDMIVINDNKPKVMTYSIKDLIVL